MLILLTNDDGINAPGIVAMYRELVKLGEVHVVAPETVQSATGHGITITTPLLTSQVTVENAFTGIAVDGRPADCVKLAVAQLLPRQPDLVVSGMNAGANVGINVIYSGTVAAAIEAAFLGLPAIAVSLYLRSDVPTDYAPRRGDRRQTRSSRSSTRACRAGRSSASTSPRCAADEQPDRREGRPPVHAAVGRHLRAAQRPARPRVLLEQQRLHARRHRRRHRRRRAARQVHHDHAAAVRPDAPQHDRSAGGRSGGSFGTWAVALHFIQHSMFRCLDVRC